MVDGAAHALSLPPSVLRRAGASRLAVREAGKGTPLVLLHGIGGSSESWVGQYDAFAGRHRVLAWDAPGYGASPDAEDLPATAEAYADLLFALLHDAGIERVHLLGQSLGALIAAAFAARHPAALRSLTLVAIAEGYGSRPDQAQAVVRRLDDLRRLGPAAFAAARSARLCGPHADERVRAIVRDVMATVRLPGYGAACGVLGGGDARAHLPHIAAPTLVLVGTDDLVTPHDRVRDLAGLVPGARFTAIADAGHACYLERADFFNAQVLDHVARHDS